MKKNRALGEFLSVLAIISWAFGSIQWWMCNDGLFALGAVLGIALGLTGMYLTEKPSQKRNTKRG